MGWGVGGCQVLRRQGSSPRERPGRAAGGDARWPRAPAAVGSARRRRRRSWGTTRTHTGSVRARRLERGAGGGGGGGRGGGWGGVGGVAAAQGGWSKWLAARGDGRAAIAAGGPQSVGESLVRPTGQRVAGGPPPAHSEHMRCCRRLHGDGPCPVATPPQPRAQMQTPSTPSTDVEQAGVHQTGVGPEAARPPQRPPAPRARPTDVTHEVAEHEQHGCPDGWVHRVAEDGQCQSTQRGAGPRSDEPGSRAGGRAGGVW